MSKARNIADLLNSSGDVKLAALDNAPAPTKADIDALGLNAAQLDAIAQSKSVTAVDVFIYDTSKDSDGGAWRKRTQGTSWYNEALNTATRGSRKEFPAVAVIVAEAAKMTIYDGDDPSMPMWMVFNRGTGGSWWRYTAQTMNNATAVVMMNGFLGLSTTGNNNGNYGGFSTLNFISDEVERWSPYGSAHASAGHRYGVTVAEANTTNLPSQDLVNLIVSGHVNDIAMTVLPNAPIDSATGLPIPTIAVATDGGISVIKDDGSVVDLTYNIFSSVASSVVEFVGEGLAWGSRGAVYIQRLLAIPESDHTTAPDFYYVGNGFARGNVNELVIGTGVYTTMTPKALALATGLVVLDKNADETDKIHSVITSDYNTGYMTGDIKLAALSDTDDTDVTDANLVTNGTFDSDISGWSGSDFAWNSAGKLERVSGSSNSSANTTFNIIKGNTYVVEYDVVHTGGWDQSNVYSNPGAGSITLCNLHGSGTTSGTFTAATTKTMTLNIYGISDFRGTFDNISVRLADTDRSVNANGLHVHGTITKTPVATGADLVGYSGFSETNYLEQPYNSDLDFGTGDFSIMLWAKLGIADSTAIYTGTSISNGIHVWCYNTYIKIYVAGQYMTLSSDPYIGSNFAHFTMVRKAGVVSVYTNGELSVTVGAAGSIVYNTMKLGYGFFSGGGTLALARISATAPSAQQIKDIYEAEKPLFQENAQATLYGTSDAVTALAHDDTTNLLHVGTSSGRSVFQGLQRVDNTTTAVGAAISASNGLVVED